MPNLFDLVIILVIGSACVAGWRLGFLARVSSWLGAGVGLVIALRSLPWIVDRLEGADSLRLALTGGGVLLAGVSIGSLIGLLLGTQIRSAVADGTLSPVDRAAGALVGVCGVVIGVWLLVPLMADFSQWPAQQARDSKLAQVIDDVFPSPPDGVQALRRVVGVEQFPRVWNALHPTPDLVDPPAESGLDPEVVAQVTKSVVQIEGTACRRIQLGSGVVISTDLVITNAHVVAGEDETSVILDDGTSVDAQVIGFDPSADLAFLRVLDVGRPPLPLGNAKVGDVGAVFGHPHGGSLRISPFQIARRVTATGNDIYDATTVRRDVFFLAANLSPGDSGAPLINDSGEVVGIAFAIAPDRAGVAYALTVPELESSLKDLRVDPVDTGSCLH